MTIALIAIVLVLLLGLFAIILGGYIFVRGATDQAAEVVRDIGSGAAELMNELDAEMATTTLPALPEPNEATPVVDIPPNQALWESFSIGGDDTLVSGDARCAVVATTPLKTVDAEITTYSCGPADDPVLVNVHQGSIILLARQFTHVTGSMTKAFYDSVTPETSAASLNADGGRCFETVVSQRVSVDSVTYVCGTPDGKGSARFTFEKDRLVGQAESNLT